MQDLFLRRFIQVCAILTCAALLTHCVSNGPRTLHFTTAQIQQKLNAKLASPMTVMKVFQVQLTNAIVSVEPGMNRLHTLMDASISGPLLAKPLHGKMDVAGVLRFDASQQAVVLDQATLESVNIEGAGEEANKWLQTVARQLGEKWLSSLVLYQVKPEDLKVGQTVYQPTDFRLQPDGLQITLMPQQP